MECLLTVTRWAIAGGGLARNKIGVVDVVVAEQLFLAVESNEERERREAELRRRDIAICLIHQARRLRLRKNVALPVRVWLVPDQGTDLVVADLIVAGVVEVVGERVCRFCLRAFSVAGP